MGRLHRFGILLGACAACVTTPPHGRASDASGLAPSPAADAVPSPAMAAAPSPPVGAVPLPPADAAQPAPLVPAARPPLLGWSSWSHLRRQVREGDVKAQADVLAAKLAPFGFAYVNVDGGWFDCCDEHGRVKPDPQKFPSGMAALAAYIHGKGLKMGIYLHPGIPKEAWQANGKVIGTAIHVRDIADVTRPGNTRGKEAYAIDYSKPGAVAHIQGYAALLASWGVDYLKLDFIGSGSDNPRKVDNREDVTQWASALKKTGRPIWFELSLNLDFAYAPFWKAYSNGWRVNRDIEYYADNTKLTTWSRVLQRFEAAPKWAPFAGPGGWNDFDSLEIGNGDSDGLTLDERRSTITLWAISCAPLILGSDLTALDPTDLTLLTNAEVIAVDQSGHVATPLATNTAQQVWRAANPDGSFTVALFNLADPPSKVTVLWRDLGLAGAPSIHDLWSHRDLGKFEGGYEVALAGHASQLLRVYP